MNTINSLILLISICLTVQQIVGEDGSLGRGFNDDIPWMAIKDGLELARKDNKPLLVLIHKSWCGACKKLKPLFAVSKEIEELSSNFVMVNIQDDEEKDLGEGFTPDGGYIPRILFLDSDGEVKTDLINEEGNPKYKYYYSDAKQVASSMKRAIDDFSSEGTKHSDEL